jgi:hypothetical protein
MQYRIHKQKEHPKLTSLATMDQSNSSNSAKEGICVAIRMRPLNEREICSGQTSIFKKLSNSNSIAQFKDGAPIEGQVYSYDKVFPDNSTTEAVYAHTCKSIVDGVTNGINGTVFACRALLSIAFYVDVM